MTMNNDDPYDTDQDYIPSIALAPAGRDAELAPRSAAAMTMATRESDEVRLLILMAQQFPRNTVLARSEVCSAFVHPRLAEQAQYVFVRGGTEITGPSIRAAEAIARAWGKIDSGYRVLSTSIGGDGVPVSEVQAYAFDYESMARSSVTFSVRHWRSTKKGGYKLTDDRDIYELIANMAARRKRACILSLIPTDLIEDAMDQAEATLATRVDMSPEGIERMVKAFAEYGVTREHIAQRIQRSVDSITKNQLLHLKRIWVSLRDGISRPGHWFDLGEQEPGEAVTALRDALGVDPATGEIAPPLPKDIVRGPAPDPVLDAAALLKRVKKAQTFEELEEMDNIIGALPEGGDRAMLVEALKHRDKTLAKELRGPSPQ